MSDQVSTDSDSEYVPGLGDSDHSDESCGSDCEYDSDDDIPDDVEPVVDQGWRFVGDPFTDARPDPVPLFTGAIDDADPAILSTTIVPSFTSPKDAFMHIFDNNVVDAMCTWMNERTDKYIAETGKRKINGVVWAPVTRADMYVRVCFPLPRIIGPKVRLFWLKVFHV